MSEKWLKIGKYGCMVLGAVFAFGSTLFTDKIDNIKKAEKLAELPKELLEMSTKEK